MKFVVDANIAFSLLKKGSFTRRLAFKHRLELFSHPFLINELEKHSEALCSKLNVSVEKFDKLKLILPKLVNLKEKPSPQQLNRAMSLISDPKDTPYLALAIKLNADIWSNDPHFKEQSVVKVFRTEELNDFLEDNLA